jgi:3-phosphoshikimate 1-carboxyvinyltransferase
MRFKAKSVFGGRISGMPAKSYLHRALLSAALSDRPVTISNIVMSEDIKATIRLIKAMKAKVSQEDSCIIVRPKDGEKSLIIDCGESGTTLRLGIPIISALGEFGEFTGQGRLLIRPIDEYLEIFKRQGLSYDYGGQLPLIIKGQLKCDHFKIDGSKSSQYISGLLMALPLIDGTSSIEVIGSYTSRSYVEMTIQILEHFGITIEQCSPTIYRIPGNQHYKSKNITIENDYSQAAFWIIGGTLGGDLIIEGLGPDSVQGDKALIEIVNRMGGDVQFIDGDLHVKQSRTSAVVIDAEQIPDSVPILTLLASVSNGTTVIEHTERLKYKESDRGRAIAAELGKLGAKIIVEEDRMVIEGVDALRGGNVDSWNDHRIAMTLAIAACITTEDITVENFNAVNKSYPDFIRDYQLIGGELNE